MTTEPGTGQSPPEIKWAEYPQRKCRLMVTGDHTIEHPCEVREFHLGPCATPASRRSISVRQAWLAANPADAEKTSSLDAPYA